MGSKLIGIAWLTLELIHLLTSNGTKLFQYLTRSTVYVENCTTYDATSFY